MGRSGGHEAIVAPQASHRAWGAGPAGGALPPCPCGCVRV